MSACRFVPLQCGFSLSLLCNYYICCFEALALPGVTRRKQQRPGIAKNDKNNGTIQTITKPTTPHPNSLRTTRQTCAPNIRRTTHSSQHSTPTNTHVTAHQRSIPQATHAHPRPRQSAHTTRCDDDSRQLQRAKGVASSIYTKEQKIDTFTAFHGINLIFSSCATQKHTTSIATKSAPYTRLVTTSALALQSQHRNAKARPN